MDFGNNLKKENIKDIEVDKTEGKASINLEMTTEEDKAGVIEI